MPVVPQEQQRESAKCWEIFNTVLQRLLDTSLRSRSGDILCRQLSQREQISLYLHWMYKQMGRFLDKELKITVDAAYTQHLGNLEKITTQTPSRQQ